MPSVLFGYSYWTVFLLVHVLGTYFFFVFLFKKLADLAKN